MDASHSRGGQNRGATTTPKHAPHPSDQPHQRQKHHPHIASPTEVSLSLTASSSEQQHIQFTPHLDGTEVSLDSGSRPSELLASASASASASRTQSHYSTGSSSNPNTSEYWPPVDSDESDEVAPGASVAKPATKKSQSSTKRFFRYIAKKFGKTYQPRYGYLPNDEQEQDRNLLQHKVILDLFDDRLHLSPVVQPRRVLDVGTGPGTWPLEFARRNPQCLVLGIDIDPVRVPASTVPRNCRFMVMDAINDWDFEEGFDFIHVRMLGDMQAKGQLIHSIYDSLNPGGWAEFTEWIVNIESPDHSLDGGAFQKWNRLLRQGLQGLGSSVFYPLEYKTLLRQVGFVQVQESKYAAPTNACYPGRRLQRVGNMMAKNWLQVIEPLSVPVFHALGWSQDALDNFLDDVKKEIEDTRYHSYMTLITIYCQKPLEGSAASSKISLGSGRSNPPQNG